MFRDIILESDRKAGFITIAQPGRGSGPIMLPELVKAMPLLWLQQNR